MCTNPIYAYRLRREFWNDDTLFNATKFNKLKFLMLNGYCMSASNFMRRFVHDTGYSKIIFNVEIIPPEIRSWFEILLIPCGKCDECALKHASMWSIRNQHEAIYHKDKCFLTLTYDDMHCPRNNGVPTVFYPDIQLFMKRLRSAIHYAYKRAGRQDEPKIRYFCCQEYGGKTCRPHFHILLYGFCPSNAFNSKFRWKRTKTGNIVYRSRFFERYWKRGMVFVGSVTKYSCGYVARYTLDKQKHKHTKAFYVDRFIEKIGMSRRDGLGIRFFKENFKNILYQGYIRDLENPNLKHSIPRGYIRYFERRCPKTYVRKYLPFRRKKYYKYLDILKSNIRSSDDYIKKFKHQFYYNKNLINSKLLRTLEDCDFDDCKMMVPIIRQ